MIPELKWELVEADNVAVIATLTDRQDGGRILVTRNAARSAELPLALDDPVVGAIKVGETLLRCTPNGWNQPLFTGRVSQLRVNLTGSEETYQVSALDPLSDLEKCLVFQTTGAFADHGAWAFRKYTATSQGAILADLINSVADNDHGILEGAITAGVNRDVSFPAGSQVSDGIRAITGLRNGGEFELQPIGGVSGGRAFFNYYYPRQGSDKSASIKLTIGIDEDDSATEFSYSPALGGVVNSYVAIGDVYTTVNIDGLDWPFHSAYQAYHPASIALVGLREVSESMSGTTSFALLEDAAKAVVAANADPIEAFSVSLDPELEPQFGPDTNGEFWIGDTIACQVGLPTETLNLVGRVAAASFTELDNGEVFVDLTCEPEDVAGVTGAQLYVVMDAGDGTVPPPPPEPEPAPEDPCAPPPPPGKDPCAKKKKDKKKGKAGGKGGRKKK